MVDGCSIIDYFVHFNPVFYDKNVVYMLWLRNQSHIITDNSTFLVITIQFIRNACAYFDGDLTSIRCLNEKSK